MDVGSGRCSVLKLLVGDRVTTRNKAQLDNATGVCLGKDLDWIKLNGLGWVGVQTKGLLAVT
jgi:hypothetical protein